MGRHKGRKIEGSGQALKPTSPPNHPQDSLGPTGYRTLRRTLRIIARGPPATPRGTYAP